MSKKSRKRNKKILGALAAGLGAMALMRGRGTAQGVSGSDKAKFTSDAAYTAPVTGTNYPGENKAVVAAPVKKSNWISSRMRGHGDKSGKIGQDIRANYAKNAQINAINTAEGSPMIDNPYRIPRVHNRFNRKDGGRASHKSGGRVKGCGIAKRGLGRAMKKGRK